MSRLVRETFTAKGWYSAVMQEVEHLKFNLAVIQATL